MNKCEHNLPIDYFCISQHCECKQPGGCQQCIKKYHTHNKQQKLISQQELAQYMKIFLTTQTSHKPNCRNIQEAFYTYFSQLKNELSHVIDLLCKTVVNSVGAPYLMQNKLFNCFKKIKHKQYRKLNQKDTSRFCQIAKHTSSNVIIKEQAKMYKEQLKKFSKLIHNVELTMVSYEELLSQSNLTFKHEKSHFQNVSSLLKQTLQTADHINLIGHVHRPSPQKNKIQKSQQRTQKSQSPLKSYNSQQYDRNKQKQTQIHIPSFHSGALPMKQLEQRTFRTQLSLIKNQPKKQPSIENDNDSHKLGVRDFKQLDKKQHGQNLNVKRPSSIERNLNSNKFKVPITEIYSGKNIQPKNNDFKLDDSDEVSSPKIQKQKICLLYSNGKKNTFGTKDVLGTETTTAFFDSEESKKTESIFEVRQRRQSSLKQAEINFRKEKLIQMMKTHNFSKKSSDPLQSKLTAIRNNPPNLMTMQYWKKDLKQTKNTSVLTNSLNDRFERLQKQEKVKKNFSQIVESKQQKKSVSPEGKQHNKETINYLTVLNHMEIDQIHPISECQSEAVSTESLEEIKQHLIVDNINGSPKQFVDEKEEKPKFLGCSRLIILPSAPIETGADSPLIKKRKVMLKGSPQKFELKNEQKSPLRNPRKSSMCSQESEKQQLTESQQRSLSFLIKSMSKKSEEAILLLENALKESSNNLSAAEYLSYLYLEYQKPKQALGICNKILGRFEVANRQNEELLLNLSNNKGAALNMLGRYSQTIVLLTKCIKIKQTERMLKNLADAYYFNSNYEKAVLFYQKAVKLCPKYDEAFHNMAVCFYLQENYHRAKNTLEKALQLTPKNESYAEFLTHILSKISI